MKGKMMSRPIGALLKEHAVLAAGIALPVLLVILFALARALPESTVEDPKYRAVFASQPYYYYDSFAYNVVEGKLKVTYKAPKEPYQGQQKIQPKIFIFDGATQKTEIITLEIPKNASSTSETSVAVKEFESLKLTSGETAPDGYIFQPHSYSRGSFITDVFTYNNRSTPAALAKNGRLISILPLRNTYSGDVRFIGWVTE